MRSERQAGWQVVTVASGGQEHQLDFPALGRGYRGASHVLGDFPQMSSDDRRELCRTWAQAVGRPVRIYSVVREVEPGGSMRTVDRVLRQECDR